MKKTFLILIGAGYHGQLLHTIQAKNSSHAFEILTAYLTANKFEGVSYDKDLNCVFAFGWHSGALFTTTKTTESQTYGYFHFSIEPAEDWVL